MQYREILTAAAALVCETVSETQSEDYVERAPYILATCVRQCASLDAKYRRVGGSDPIEYPKSATVSLDSECPLLPELTPAVTFYLAAMLVVDENEVLSDKLYDLFTDQLATLHASLPMLREKITNKYGA